MPSIQNTPLTLDRFFRALADPTRLRLLNLMSEQEVCVCYFTEVLGAPQPKISRHLAYLRKAGIVVARRDGKWMHYRLTVPKNPHAAAVLKSTMAALRGDKQMQRTASVLRELAAGQRV